MAARMIRYSTPWRDGYFARFDDDPHYFWVNNNPGAGGGQGTPSPPNGFRHFMVDTGFPAELIGADQNAAAFESIANRLLGVTFIDVGGGAMTIGAPPAYGGMTLGGVNLVGDMGELLSTLGAFIPSLTAPPARPPIVPGDDETNFKNLYLFIAAQEAHFRRDEAIRLIADGAGVAFRSAGIQSIRMSELAQIAAAGLAVLATPPAAPTVVPTGTGGGLLLSSGGGGLAATDDNDVNFDNLGIYLDSSAKFAKRDELVRAVGDAIALVLKRRGN